MFETLREYFSFDFVWFALIVAVLVSLCSALLGVSLVLKRYSMIGDGLSHVAFGAGAVAAVVGVTDNMLIVLPITVIVAIVLLKTSAEGKIKGDAAIAMLSVGALSVGYLLLNITETTSSNLSGDVCTSLFGSTSILSLDTKDVVSCVVLSLVVIATFFIFYNKIFSVTFDERFSEATGTKTKLYNLIIAVITAIVIVVGMKLVGALLVSALIIFPALSAMRVFKSFRGVICGAAVISVIGAGLGVISAVLLGTPVGASIVVINIVALAIFSLVGKIKSK
ncbi:MAG: metal ABC transporter permease [Ruminococcaceae bacterium]|nr:metal ABC transporter permease [Oscillospiraceae bacterium]